MVCIFNCLLCLFYHLKFMVSWIVLLPFLSLSFSNCAMIIFSAIPSLINGIYLSFSSHSVILLLWLLSFEGSSNSSDAVKNFWRLNLFIYLFFLLVIPLPAWARWKPFVDSLSLFLSLSSSFRNWLVLSFFNTILEVADYYLFFFLKFY